MLFGPAIGVNVSRLRQKRGMSQIELARLLGAEGGGWRRSKVATLESGGRETLTIDELVQLAAALGAKWSDLLAGETDLRLGDGGVFVRAAELRESLVQDRPPATVLDSVDAVEAFLAGAVMHDRADPFGMHLAARLRVPQPTVNRAAQALYRQTVTQEREQRVGVAAAGITHDAAYRRRTVSRQMEQEIVQYFERNQR